MSVATADGGVDTSGLADSIATDMATESPEPQVETPPTENEPNPQGDKQEDDGKPESEPVTPDTPDQSQEPKKEEKTDEEKAPEDDQQEKTEEKDKEDDPQDKTIKIGNREFATPEDAIGEAKRVIGHNANLAGDLKVATERTEDLQKQLNDAMEANKEWAEYAESLKKGDVDPDKIAQRAVRTMREEEVRAQKIESMKTELSEIEKLDNYNDVYSILTKIADKSDPLTGVPFTPKSAYAFAVKQLGLPNLLEKSTDAPPTEKPKEAPKPPPDMGQHAQRPTGKSRSMSGASKTEDVDKLDKRLDQQFSIL